MRPFLAIVAISFIGILGFAIYRTWILSIGQEQHVFSAAALPTFPLIGNYNISSNTYIGPLKGKSFDQATNTGINLFRGTKLFKYRTYIGKGIVDKDKDVFKLDYNIDDNPFILRPFLDEVLEIKPGLYIGKSYFRLIPGFPFIIGFFRLEPGPYEAPPLIDFDAAKKG